MRSTAFSRPAASAEFVYRRERRDFGDLGLWLGQAIAERLAQGRLPWPLLPAIECIRATALGASEYSVQTSGETSMISSPADLLPRRNLPVLQPPFDFTPSDRSGGARCTRSAPIARLST